MANTARRSSASSQDRMQVLAGSVLEVVPLAPATAQPAVTSAGHQDLRRGVGRVHGGWRMTAGRAVWVQGLFGCPLAVLPHQKMHWSLSRQPWAQASAESVDGGGSVIWRLA